MSFARNLLCNRLFHKIVPEARKNAQFRSLKKTRLGKMSFTPSALPGVSVMSIKNMKVQNSNVLHAPARRSVTVLPFDSNADTDQ